MNRRGASTVISVLLLVAVTVIVDGVVTVGALTFLDGTGAATANADFTYERTPAGLEMTPKAIRTTATVQLNGRDMATFTPDSAGQSVLLPTAPGDGITVVSQDRGKSVLVDRILDDRSEVGDFIAYYTFDKGSGTTLVDWLGSGNAILDLDCTNRVFERGAGNPLSSIWLPQDDDCNLIIRRFGWLYSSH